MLENFIMLAGGDLVFPPCSNCTTLIQQIQYLDSLTDVGFGGILGIVFLLVIGGVLFLMQKAFAVEKAFAVSMFITSFIGFLLAAMDLVASKIIYLCLTTLVISIFLLTRSQDRGF